MTDALRSYVDGVWRNGVRMVTRTDPAHPSTVIGIDTAASRLEAAGPDGNVRESVVRCYRGSEREREVERARRDQALLEAISIRLPFVPRPVLADPEGELLGEAVIVLTWIPGSLSLRRRAAL
jgi:hypothetical protein